MAERIFKYMKSDVAKLVLQNKTIRFTSPLEFNDPYDAHPPYKFINTSITETEKCNLEIGFKGLADDTLILSLSKTNKNLMMWGHYADCHKGIVIEFNPEAEILNYGVDVKYYKKILELKNTYNQYCAEDGKALIEALHLIFTTKNICWKYEKEKRIIQDKPLRINYLKEKTKLSDKDTEKLKAQNYIDNSFETKDIKTVYFGYKTDQKVQDELINILKKEYSHITTVYKAKLSDKEYKILFEEIKI